MEKGSKMRHVMLEQISGIIEEEPWFAAALANISAVIAQNMEDLNWAGFYLIRDGQLVVGPFQGKPACIHIPVGKGVCGTCVEQDRTIVVPDVHAFPGHIACDSASRSEIVIPIHAKGKVIGVMDIDSPVADRFSEQDQRLLEEAAFLIEEKVSWSGLETKQPG